MYVLDLKKELSRAKARKDIFAFAGFELALLSAVSRQGVLTVTRATRPDGSGQLKCTFMVDVEGDAELAAAAGAVFQNLAARVLDPLLGPLHGQDFEYVLPLARRELQDKVWFVQEADFSLKDIRRNGRDFIERRLLPALQRTLPITFHAVEWWRDEERWFS